MSFFMVDMYCSVYVSKETNTLQCMYVNTKIIHIYKQYVHYVYAAHVTPDIPH
jgi:hypothetical protein